MLPALALTVLLVLSAPARAKVVLLNAGGAVVATPVRDPYTTLVGWSDDGTALLVRREDRMLRLDLAGGATARLAPLDDALSVGPSGRAIVVHGTFDSARVELRETDGRLLGAQTVRADFRARPSAAWSPDGRRVAVAVPPHLLVFDTFSGVPVLRRTLTEPGLARQAFSPDAAALLVSDGPRVLRIDLPSGADSVAVRLPKDSVGVAAVWGAGGRIAVTHDARLRISGTPAVATRLPVIALDDPLWNKDGSALAYTFIAPARYDCELPRYGVGQLTPGGAPQTLLAPSGAAVRAVAWSPDGQTLAVDTDRDFSLELERRHARHPWPKHIARDYAMFSRRGDAAIRRIVLRAARALRRGAGRAETMGGVSRDLERVARRFSEAHDTAVEEALATELDRWLKAAGFTTIEARDEFSC